MKKVRGDSGKKARYEQATEKYKLFQQKKDRINQMDSILTGKQSEVIVPKPGEFFVVSSDSLPNVNRKLINQMREQQNTETSPSQFGNIEKQKSQYNQQMAKPPLSMTDRKGKERNERNRSHHFSQQNMPPSASYQQPITPSVTHDGMTMTSLQGEMTKQMSLPTFKKFQPYQPSHDFPQRIFSGNNVQPRDSLQANQQEDQITSGPTNFEGMSHARFERQSLDSIYEKEGVFEQNLKRKQLELLQNPRIKASLTTNIRNIMRNQDKGLLTTSTRLLNAQVKRAEMKTEQEKYDHSMSPGREATKEGSSKKAISTVDLLRKQKEVHNKMRQLSHDAHETEEYSIQPRLSHQQMTNHASVPVFPTMSSHTIQQQAQTISQAPEIQMFSQRDPFLLRLNQGGDSNRPVSTILMQGGDKDSKKMIKKKFDLANARARDPTKAMSHSYKSKLNNPRTTSQKWKDQQAGISQSTKNASGIAPRLPTMPILVQYQNALARENKNISPFMITGPDLDPQIATIQPPKFKKQEEYDQLKPSQSTKNFRLPGEPLQEIMKYSESMSMLKQLRDAEETGKNRPSSSIFKKGTADFLKRKILQSIGREAYETGEFQKSLEKRFGTEIQGDSRDRTFLPIEAFDPLLDMEVPQDVIEQYRDYETGLTIGLSKWNFPSGEAELRECIVDGYIKNQDLYEISWCHNPQIKKKVSRFNLIFKLEDQEEYERRIFLAHKFRQDAEILMRYHYMIDKTQIPKVRVGGGGKKTAVALPELLDSQKTRISYLISTFKPFKQLIQQRPFKNVHAFFTKDFDERYRNIKFFQRWKDFNATEHEKIDAQINGDMKSQGFDLVLLTRLFKELDEDFIRAHKQIYFDLQLPYDKEKFKMFNSVLPPEKFIPIPELKADESKPPALKKIRRGATAMVMAGQEREENDQDEVQMTVNASGQKRQLKSHPNEPTSEYRFKRRLAKMQDRLHQGDARRLKILQITHSEKQKLVQMRVLELKFTEPCKLEFMRKEHNIVLGKFIGKIRDFSTDRGLEVKDIINENQKEIDQYNQEERKKMTHNQEQYEDREMDEDFIRQMRRFQRVIQIQLEDVMKQVFISSIQECKEHIRFAMKQIEESTGKPMISMDTIEVPKLPVKFDKEDVLRMSRDAVMQTRFSMIQCFQFDITLEFDKDKKEIKANPHAEDWINAIPQHFEASLKNLTDLECFLHDHDKLGRIHPYCGHAVFQTDPAYPEEYPEREVLHITFLLQRLFKVLEAALEAANEYSYILQENIKDYSKRQKNNDLDVDQYQKLLKENKRKEEEIDELFFEEKLCLGPIVLRVDELKKRLKKELKKMNDVLLEQIKRKVEQSKQQIGEEVDNVLKIIQRKDYVNIEQVTETKKFIKMLPDKSLEIQRLIKGVNDKIDVLDENFCPQEEEDMIKIWEAFARPMEIQMEQGDCIDHLEELSVKFQGDLSKMQFNLTEDIQKIQEEFESIQEYEQLSQHLEAFRRTDALDDKIDDAIGEAEKCNRWEKLFGQSETDFSGIKSVKEKFDPFSKLWELASQYNRLIVNWMEESIAELDGDELPRLIDEALGTLKFLKIKKFKEHPHTALICQELRDNYQKLKPFMPILSALKNPDFKIPHFDIVRKDYGIVIETSLTQSLQQLKDIGIMDISDMIVELSGIATKERQLELQLNKMNDEWKSVKFELAEFRDSEVYILQGLQPIWDLLDEHIQKTMIIASSPYAKYFNSEATYWKNRLVKVQEVLEEWARAQRGWCYLWPIFNSPDIQTQLPEVYTNFTSIDQKWRLVMSQTQQNPIVLDACNQNKAQENLHQCNETIETVKKKLNEYLHSKQMLFPRFFFLSNDDLLHILSQTKDPVRVQDHLNKCFEGIQTLNFTAGSLIVTSMCSSMDEEVKFIKSIDPFIIKVHKETIEEQDMTAPTGRRHRTKVVETTVKEVRAIEDWLSDVEFQMRDSLRNNIIESTVKFQNTSKATWIFAWPQQIVLAIDQIEWTQKMEKAISSEAENSLKFAARSEEEKVSELVTLIRTPNLSKTQMRTLESLIVTDVHSRDVTQEIMELNVRDTSIFEWISQLRHYTGIEESGRVKKVNRLEIKISMINSTRYYGFEYQGSQTRLVITPLTDRCYRTLMGALQMNLGGAPEGPAGTGKTETTKDLAKALAKQCLVFNCSDQIDVSTMNKFFKGLACCGAWACFDEFNRIELEVLSVIAQQILQIQNALMRRQPNAPFMFEDEQIVLDAQCAVFITMNPTYAGRSQLPDNLKALFRPVAMMIPNYETIAEIQLYSYGFQNARPLSVKIVQSLKLSSEQLSTQSHYDYGMRAVKSIILASGALRKEFPDQDEDITVLRAISVCNIPKFIKEDIDQFGGIISDLFPTTPNEPQKYDVLKHYIEQSIAENSLQRNEEFETKIIQLYETVQVRHGLMLVGAPMGGKTTILRTLADALSRIERLKYLEETGAAGVESHSGLNESKEGSRSIKSPKVTIHSINPKSVSISKLYGDYGKVGDWMDGILATTVREAASDKSGDIHWVMLDGPVDTLWIENLNTVLDDNKKLCLISGEIIKLTQKMTMMFEVEDLLEASPATVSRCGMVYVTPEKLGWEPLLSKWVSLLPEGMKENGMQTIYSDLIMAFVPEIMRFLFGKEQSQEEDLRLEGLKSVLSVSKNWLFRSFLNLFEALLLDNETKESYIEKNNEVNEKKEINKKKKDQSRENLKSHRTNRTNEDDNDIIGSFGRVKTVVEQKYFDVCDPKLINLIVQKFMMAIIWGFGASLSVTARPKYSLFLHEQILKVFQPSTCQFEFKKRIDMQIFPRNNCNLFSIFFHSKNFLWHKWDYEIEKYDILGDKEVLSEATKVFDGSKTFEEDDSAEKGAEMSQKSGGGMIELNEEFTNKVEFQNIMIATEDSIQQQYIMEMVVGHQVPMLIVGDTGTGKTRSIKKLISLLLNRKNNDGKYGWESGEMVLSATSTPQQIQSYTESKLEKHKKGVYGPKNPSNHLVIFIDDLNMPVKEKFGAQPSLEMMRQIMDSDGFYNEKTLEFSKVVRQIFLCAMGTPGGGRSLPSIRLMRHFNLFSFPNMSKETMTRIFKKILEWGFTGYSASWQKQIITMTELTIETYRKTVEVLLPLPRKAHYLFNMRQVSEIIQGIFSVPAEVIENAKEKLPVLKRLWLHEVMRVFSDRLISIEDKELFINQCFNCEESTFIKKEDLKRAQNLIFCNFVDPSQEIPVYMESQSNDSLRNSLARVIENYNASRTSGREKLSILLFDYFLQHLARVSRIISKPFGNGLLIGLGGNGRKTIAKLATFINECQSFHINLHKNYGRMEWLDDLRNLYKTLGLDNKKIVFSFSDKEIREESFIEDINNILNVGELTSLFTAEDEDDNHSEIEMQLKKAKVRDTSQEATHNFFIKRCKRNLHLLLFMSPAGNQLQNYFRKYPSLVNCTSIDWFLNWPTEALQAVSDHYLLKLHGIIYESTQTLSQYKSTGAGEQHKPGENSTQQRALETIAEGFEDRDDGSVVDKIITERRKSTRTQNEIVQELPMTTPNLMDEEMIDSEVQEIAQMPLRERISNIFTQIHESAMELVETYALETKRQVYVTPVMFMNVFELFGQVLARKNEEIERERSKYEQGVRKLEQAKIMIENMEETLTQLQPRLVAKTKEVEKLVKELDKESARVTEIKEVVDTETAEAEIKKQKADQLKAHCEMKLNKAQPLFDKAIKALRTLSSSDFVVLKSFQNPPPGVRLALEGCCVMLGIAPVYKKVDGVKVADYWDKSKKLTKNYKSLLDQLENYNKENISPAIIEKIQPYLENPAFQPDQVKSASNAAEGLCKWVIAITEFDKVYKEITPKRRSLEEAEETVRITQAELQIKQEQLNQLQEQLAQLQAMNMERQQEKADLLRERADAQSKLERANALMQSIGSEKDRWIATKSKLAEDKLSLLGDMILASCFVNYLGPFEGTYRMRLINESWTKLNTKYQIKFSEDFVLRDILGDVEKISDWTLRGLPNENTAYENMIIIDETIEKKYPVIIDPQGQAFRYMRDNIGQTDAGSQNSQNRVCLKASAPNSTKILLNALEYGSVVFCENAGEVTNPQLLSILRKDLQTIQSDLYIVYNDQTVRFDIDFRLYVFSHLSNPHFSPEVQQLSKVLNFSVTREGLEQQLLQIICRHELSREEEDRERYAKQTIQLSKRKRQVFDKILATLRNSGDEILESDGFVKQLNESKETTTEIEKKLKQAKNNEDKIRDLREKFEVTAKQGARLYFAVQDLQLLDNMYQFSMSWFRGLFSQTFVVQQEQNSDEESKSQAEEDGDDVGAKKHRPTGRVPTNDLTKKQKLEEMTKRAAILKTQFREILFRNVCMSLFEHHKLLFAFYISLKVYENDKTFQEGLDRLEKQPDRKPKENSKLEPSRFDNSSKVSDQKSSNNKEQSNAQSIAQTRVSMPRNSKQGRGVLSRHNDSDQMTAINEERELQQKEEDKKLAIDATLLKFTLTGLMLSEAEPYVVVDNTRPDLFTDAMWSQLHQLTSFACLETLLENIISDFASWEKFMHCDKGEQAFELLPEPYQSTLPHFAWIPLVRCIKPELTTAAIRRYVQKSLGKFFITPIIFHVKDAFNDSKYHTPLLLILTPGNDPMEQIKKLSEEKQRTVTHVSLGKGQGEKAKQLIKKYKLGAGWIVLQNCHLSKSFLPELEQIIEGLQPQTGAVTQGSAATIDYEIEKKDVTHPDFRIWLTSMSVDYFPQMLLQQSLKITSEPPKGIKSSMIRAYAALKSSKTEQEFYSANKKQEIWQKLYLSLSFFHAIVRERKRFGALGWTTQYDFNDSDFRVSMRQLYLMVETFDQVPFKALRYLTGLCNYGGRVTDDRDRRTLATLLNDFYNEDVIEHKTYFIVNEKFKKYYIHSGETWKDYQGFVQGLPDEESPMLMGLHDNAIIQQAINEANTIFQNTLKLTNSSQSNDSGSSAEESTSLVRKMTRDILDKIREPFKIKEVEKKYPFNYLDSMNSVLLQELARYNTLIETIRESLNVMLMTLEGKLVFNAETDELLTSIKNNIIPEKWKKKSYPSMKPLLAYIEDLKKRLGVFEEWIEKGKPNCFWISGFFFTQSFLTGVKQNYARKNQYPIDKVEFTYDVLKFSEEAMAHSLAPVNGCYLSGLYIEGAAWDDANGILRESDPKIIHVSLPVMHFIPKYQLSPGSHDPGIPAELSVESSEPVSAEISSIHQPQRFIYECPTYKTSERAGQLLTTGHNTNYIQMIDLPSGQEPSLWIRRGVALLCQLDH